jgi:hypothetical protein
VRGAGPRWVQAALDERAELLPLPVGQVDEVERVPVEVGAHEDGGDLDHAAGVLERERQLGDGGGGRVTVEAQLDPARAEVDGRRVPAVAAVLRDAYGQRHARARRRATLGRSAGGGRRRRFGERLEAEQDVAQVLEHDGLVEAVHGAEAQAVACLALREHAGDHHDGNAEPARALQLQEVHAAHVGQAHVEEHHVRGRLAELQERGLRRVGDERLVAELHEVVVEDSAELLVVLDDENAHLSIPGVHSGRRSISNDRALARCRSSGCH